MKHLYLLLAILIVSCGGRQESPSDSAQKDISKISLGYNSYSIKGQECRITYIDTTFRDIIAIEVKVNDSEWFVQTGWFVIKDSTFKKEGRVPKEDSLGSLSVFPLLERQYVK